MRFPYTFYEDRAIKAYFRNGGTQQPSRTASETVMLRGQAYVVLRNINGVLKVYRIERDGRLRGLEFRPEDWDTDVIARALEEEEQRERELLKKIRVHDAPVEALPAQAATAPAFKMFGKV